jgi:hypothetical protein
MNTVYLVLHQGEDTEFTRVSSIQTKGGKLTIFYLDESGTKQYESFVLSNISHINVE